MEYPPLWASAAYAVQGKLYYSRIETDKLPLVRYISIMSAILRQINIKNKDKEHLLII